MTGVQRRKKILEMLGQSSTPLSGGALGRAVGVSRQVVVQDIALLRTEGHPVLATARGYVLEMPHQTERLFKMCHTTEQTREELNTIVDLGGEVLDVMVNHRIYGKVSAPLNIRSRRDVEAFVENIRTGRSTPLLNVTSGYHFHHVAADQEEILDEIEAALDDVNVAKYARYLRSMTGHTQFIAITHRRGTMEEADVLYGVTMQEEGVSKLIELRVGELEEKLGIGAGQNA